jgi:hypothetical protein
MLRAGTDMRMENNYNEQIPDLYCSSGINYIRANQHVARGLHAVLEGSIVSVIQYNKQYNRFM